MIARDPEASVYRQLARILRDRIESGEYAAGQPIPSEGAMVQEHGVSRDTVRKAIAVLRTEGRVIVTAGRVTRVADAGVVETVKVPRGARVTGRAPSAVEQVDLRIGDAVWVFVVEYGGTVTVHPADRTVLTFA